MAHAEGLPRFTMEFGSTSTGPGARPRPPATVAAARQLSGLLRPGMCSPRLSLTPYPAAHRCDIARSARKWIESKVVDWRAKRARARDPSRE